MRHAQFQQLLRLGAIGYVKARRTKFKGLGRPSTRPLEVMAAAIEPAHPGSSGWCDCEEVTQ